MIIHYIIFFIHINRECLIKKLKINTKNMSYEGCKRCGLGVGDSPRILSAEAKVISPLPGEYGRKAET